MPKVSVIIPSMPGREQMLKRLLSTIPDDYEKIVVDDQDLLLAAKRNKGAKKAIGEYLFFVDDDNFLEKETVEIALDMASQQEIGVLGFMACYDDKKFIIADGGSNRNYLTGFTKGINTNERWPGLIEKSISDSYRTYYYFAKNKDKNCYEVDEVANAFVIHRELFFELHGFDEKNFPIDLDEADLCKRIKDKGYKIMMCPMARCYHNSQTYSCIPDFRRPMNAYFMGRNKILYQKKHLSKIKLLIYFLFFLPISVFGYSACLLYRRKPWMVFYFLQGTFDGLRNSQKNPYQ